MCSGKWAGGAVVVVSFSLILFSIKNFYAKYNVVKNLKVPTIGFENVNTRLNNTRWAPRLAF